MRHRVASPRAVVVGLDISLTGTGVAVLSERWQPGNWNGARSWRIGRPLSKGASPRERVERLHYLVEGIVEMTAQYFPTHIGVEDYAFAAMQSHTRSIAELTGAVKLAFFDRLNIVVQPVTSSAWRKLLLGYGRAKNIKEIAQASIREVGGPFHTGDECDAFGVANWIRSDLSLPALTLA